MGGAGRLAAMIGANNFAIDKNRTLSFRFMSGKRGIKYVKIILNGKDLYDMEFFNSRGKIVEEKNDVYANQLISVFESVTGLSLRL